MFRNPRDSGSGNTQGLILPSTGRPPTPPSNSNSKATDASSYFAKAANTTVQSGILTKSPPQLPVLGRQPVARNSGKRNGLKQNQSILNFFGKAPSRENSARDIQPETGLFFEDTSTTLEKVSLEDENSVHEDLNLPDDILSNNERYNELETPSKRRKIEAYNESNLDVRLQSGVLSTEVQGSGRDSTKTVQTASPQPGSSKVPRQLGGFLDDSSDEEILVSMTALDGHSENHEVSENANSAELHIKEGISLPSDSIFETVTTMQVPLRPPDESRATDHNVDLDSSAQPQHPIPALKHESTSLFAPREFNENDDFADDEFFEEGEEYLERRWMEEQREMEIGLDEDSKSESGGESIMTPRDEVESSETMNRDNVADCPMCDGNMGGLTEAEASAHVNACLDGNATPLPKRGQQQVTVKDESEGEGSSAVKKESKLLSIGAARFKRAAIARPGQSNPFGLSKDGKSGASAFSRLMSGHAEDAAWAEAAHNEAISQGKPAYQRTCPFYKIMPGFYICVDAFRYGKVEGQNAYFLSHFHSDHYIGLTSSWCHGPIYASKVTCNLMRQQLRVDPKWIVPLEFEKKVEVPNTKGVFVTMIPANHCPGSSLYLFEKVVGTNKDGSPKLNRVLHCGDFRACPAHVYHPLLRPDVLDAITGKYKEQTIDTCYLDTTYLTPKYAFPSQFDVIEACAQMCVSLSNEIPDTNDDWEKIKVERAGSTMTKFLEKGELNSTIKPEDDESEDKKPKVRGRLLVVIGTYSIGKERICLGIAKALKSKIFAPPAKMRICACLEDRELSSMLTNNPLEAQVHMQTLMEIRAETLHDYLVTYHGHFSRVVGFRPTGWSYRPPTSRFTENPAVNTVLHSEGWKSKFTMRDLVPQRGSTRQSNCFGVPYSEHSSFRELTMFCCSLKIGRIVPTVNVGSAKSRERMKGWIEKWEVERRKNGLFKVDKETWGGDSMLRYGV